MIRAYKSLEMESNHPDNAMSGIIEAVEVDERIYSGCERTVQPTTTLRDEFCGRLGDVGFGRACFHIPTKDYQ